MNQRDRYFEQLTSAFADDLTQRLVGQCIRQLQKHTEPLSGDDAGLANAWDEICVQLQDERSGYWDAYDEFVKDIVHKKAAALKEHERMAIWMETIEGSDWLDDQNPHHEPDAYITDHIAASVYERGRSWSNGRIRAYLDR